MTLPLHDVFPHLIAKGEVPDEKSCKKCSRLGSRVDYSKASLHHKEGGDLPFTLARVQVSLPLQMKLSIKLLKCALMATDGL